MSRRDTYHYVVKDALIREGWTITHDPYVFKTDPKLSADLGAERLIAAERGVEKIVVEIKSFLRASQVVDLEDAVGQYNIYHFFLQQKEPDRTLYLAVPTHAFDNILQREVGRNIMNAYGIHVIVYSITEEEPLVWKPPESFINDV